MKISKICEVLLPSLVMLVFALVPTNAKADFDELPYAEVKCRDELIATLQDWKVKGVWHPLPTVTINQPTYIAKTQTLGTWVEIQILPNDSVAATRITAHSQIGLTWGDDSKKEIRKVANEIHEDSCQPNLKNATREVFRKAKNEFSDKDLKNKIESNTSGGILYIWSPNMDYSIRGIAAIKQASQNLHLPVTYLLDSNADLESAKKIQKKLKLDPSVLVVNHSLELYLRGIENHFPSVQVYKSESMRQN